MSNAYNPDVWKLGYQSRQVGVAGTSIYASLYDPPDTMTTAVENPSVGPEGPGKPEPFPIYQ